MSRERTGMTVVAIALCVIGCRNRTVLDDAGTSLAPVIQESTSASSMAATTCEPGERSAIDLTKINVSLTIEIVSASQPILRGTTNLPDGTEIMCDISDEKWFTADPNKPSDGYIAQAKTQVCHGYFDCGPFGFRGRDFPPGKYQASALVSVPGVQPPSVQKTIGSKGENLHGPLVHASDFGSPVVEVKKRFVIERGD